MEIPIQFINQVKDSKKRGVLIAQIGKGNYKKTDYKNFEETTSKEFTTGYTFEAVACELLDKGYKLDGILLVGTESSYWGSLCNFFSEDQNIETLLSDRRLALIKDKFALDSSFGNNYTIENIKEDEKIRDLVEEYLSERIGAKLGSNSIIVKISINEYGTSQEELNSNFLTLKNDFSRIFTTLDITDENEKFVFFDISNGFRSLPMYIYTFVNYLARTQGEKYKLSMYYGMFEAQREFEGIAPLINLKHINEIMKWLDAANEFHSYGSVYSLVQVLSEPDNEQWQKELGNKICRDKGQSNKDLKSIFEFFDFATNANNLPMIKDNLRLICEIRNYLDEEIAGIPEYAKELLLAISENLCECFQFDQFETINYTYGHLSIHLADWFFKQHRIGNAAAAIQEGLTTYVFEKWPDKSRKIINLSIYKHKSRNYIPEGTNLDLGDYEIRGPVGEVFVISNPTGNRLLDDINHIRRHIRNPAAHISFSGDNLMNEDNLENSVRILENFIERMKSVFYDDQSSVDRTIEQILNDYMNADNGQEIISNIEEEIINAPIKNIINARLEDIKSNVINNTARRTETTETRYDEELDRLEQSIVKMRDIELSNDSLENKVSKFKREFSKEDTIIKLMEKHVPEDDLLDNDESIKKRITVSASNGKKGYVRFVNWLASGNAKDYVFELLKSRKEERHVC